MAQGDVLIDLIECVDFAAIKHRNQRRKDSDSTPYINHPIGKVKFPRIYMLCVINMKISQKRWLYLRIVLNADCFLWQVLLEF
jgi:hypothetical protein